jgi:hypothetical protein
MRKQPIYALLLAAALCGCASSSANIQASYVSPLQYQSYTCAQLSEEARAVSSRAAQVAGVQDSNRTSDAVVTTVKGDGPTAAELARLKGDMEAIERASIQKNCGIKFERAPPPPEPPPPQSY